MDSKRQPSHGSKSKKFSSTPVPDSDKVQWVETSKLPREEAVLTIAPEVPSPIMRDYRVLLQVNLTTQTKLEKLTTQYKYEKWNFDSSVPGPFICVKVGDVVELSLLNLDETGNPHNIDCHAFTGPGAGAAAL